MYNIIRIIVSIVINTIPLVQKNSEPYLFSITVLSTVAGDLLSLLHPGNSPVKNIEKHSLKIATIISYTADTVYVMLWILMVAVAEERDFKIMAIGIATIGVIIVRNALEVIDEIKSRL